ncbi:MAG: Yip1 family protein [Meiothermus sp.]|nr:Yip1 family protein [Meiothermus sp.]
MLEVLTQPTAFFKALQERKPNLTAPFLISILAVALGSVAGILSTRLLPSLLPFPLPLQIALALVSSVVIGILVWGVGGAVVRVFAGPESRAWEVYGWAALPGAVLALVLIPMAAFFPITGDLPPIPQVAQGDPSAQERLLAWQRQFQEVIRASSYIRAQQVLTLLVTAWTLWVLYSGLRVLAPERALTATVAVTLLSLALTFFSLFR